MYNTDLPNRADLPSTRQLLKSTVWATIAAAALLVTIVLPSEYGIDPTGAGRLLGLKSMGEIKQSLAKEAARASQTAASPDTAIVPPSSAAPPSPPGTALAKPASPAAASPAAGDAPAVRTDEVTLTLKPGEGAEIKLTMAKGAKVRYEWVVTGGLVNFDTHGDPGQAPKGFYHGYGKGKGAPQDKGDLVAAFDGAHGWFWRNRSDATVTLTIKTGGEYSAIKRVT